MLVRILPLGRVLAVAFCVAAGARTLAAQQPPIPAATTASASANPESGGLTEEELRRMLVGKPLYLRGGYLDDSLSFNEHGALIGHAPQGSYTLCGVEISKVRLTKHKLELEGARYGLHFLGALPYEDPAKAVDRVRITPKKKTLRISIDRELVVKPKKEKEKAQAKGQKPAPAAEGNAADPLQAEIAAAPAAERPADARSVTTTTSPAHAAQLLREALDRVFAAGLDERMIASMPSFWKLYYQAAAERTDYHPADPAVLRQSMADQKARLLTTFEPGSNQYAQDNGVAGMALYHVVVGADGKPGEIAVARPIGFGLDENAVAALAKARFQPAIRNGQPVAVLLDLVVEFRIYSQRTAAPAAPGKESAPAAQQPILPGPYSVQHP